MEPKFQSSFIPKGPLATSSSASPIKAVRKGGLFSFVSLIIFVISLLLAVAVLGYKFYVKASINRMSQEIEVSRGDLVPNSANDFIRLNDRLISTQTLLDNHIAVSPLFDFLEATTLKSVRFDDFVYNTTPAGIELTMRGQARGYAAVALQSDVFNKSPFFIEPVFSDLRLNESGNVVFTFKALISPSFVSYKKQIENEAVPIMEDEPALPVDSNEATATSTESNQATSTEATSQN